MRDIPVFTTLNGAASLTLREIPYRKEAYIKLQDSLDPLALVQECADFCRCCGAEKVYASGSELLERFPLYTALWQMRAPWASVPRPDAYLWPVLPENSARWQEICNSRMADVPAAHYMTDGDVKAMVEKGDGYFVHRDGTLLGIGRAYIDRIEMVASVVPGSGEQVMAALCSALGEEQVTLEVSSENHDALRLYRRMGFTVTAELERWYKII